MRIDKPEVKQEVSFNAVNSASVSNNSLFLDSSDNIIKQKDNSGDVVEVNSSQIIYSRDLTSSDVSGADVSYTTVKSVSIPANIFKRLMFIDVYYRLRAVNDTNNASTGKIKLLINGSDAYEIPSIIQTGGFTIGTQLYADSMITVPFRDTDVDLTNSVLVEVDVGVDNVLGSGYSVSAECKGLVIRGN